MTVKMQQRRGTAAQWTSANPVLADGEIGVETDTLRAKIGNGSTAWASLTYFTLENGSVGTTKLADSAVTSGKIADGAVTAPKILIGAATFGSGTGVPEGVVTAAPGSTWLQTDSTTDVKGWIRWVKATGTGNTGWVAGPEADTGWRDMSGLKETIGTLTLNVLEMRRVGPAVALRVSLADSSSSETTLLAAAIPAGFRPLTTLSAISNRGGVMALNDHASWQVLTNGNFVYGVASGSTYSNEITWSTNDAWPASLPGSAA